MTLPACPHRWRLTEPAGPLCTGTCRRCGDERQFPTSGVETTWGRLETDHTADERRALREAQRAPRTLGGKAW